MIRVRSLTKRYGETLALDDVDVTVPEGSVYGLVGPNGAGKTTLLSILAGLRRADAGTVALDADPHQWAVLPDAPRFDKWLTAREIVALSAELGGVSRRYRIEEVLAGAGLADAADRRVGGFSRGMLQRLGIAATVVTDPKLVILDEPAAALDPAGRREVLDLVDRMRGASTVLFSSHILGDVQAVCDRVGILDHGRLLFEGEVSDLLERGGAGAYVVRLRGDGGAVAERLRTESWVGTVDAVTETVLRITVSSTAEAEERLVTVLAAAGVPVVSVEPELATLEDVFLELTR